MKSRLIEPNLSKLIVIVLLASIVTNYWKFTRIPIAVFVVVIVHNYTLRSQSNPFQSFNFNNFDVSLLSPYQKIYVSDENAEFIKFHIQKELESQGLDTLSPPDLFVNISVKIEQEVQTRDPVEGEIANVLVKHPEYELGHILIGVYNVGTIYIQIVDATNNKEVWSGSRTVTLWENKQPKILRKTKKAISKILKKFDVADLVASNRSISILMRSRFLEAQTLPVVSFYNLLL